MVFVIVLSVLILVHEFGHFFVAKRAGILVEEFGIGLPPRLFGKKFGETLYSVNLFPIGGFVKLHGEQTEKEATKPNRAFINKSKKTRSLIIIAGVVMNFVLAILAFAFVYSVTGIPRQTENVKIVEIAQNSPAEKAGVKENDVVREVDGQKISSTSQFIKSIESRKGEEARVIVERNGNVKEISLTPRTEPPEREGPIGVIISTTETYLPPLWQRPFIGVYYGFQEAIFWGGAVIAGIIKIFSDLFAGQVPKDLAGPVGIFAITSEAASYGYLAVINFVGILSVNLAILNILPFPALDGGRLLFIGIESIFGRRVLPKVEATIHTLGMVVLILVIIAITAHDIRRLISAGGISQFIDSVLK